MKIKKIFLILMCFVLVSTVSFSQTASDIIFEQDFKMKNIELGNALLMISKAVNLKVTTTQELSKKKIDLYIKKGSSLSSVLNVIKHGNSLKEIEFENEILLAKQSSSDAILVGTVYDENHAPLEGVSIKLVNSGYQEKLTSNSGIYIYPHIVSKVSLIEVKKDGYKTVSKVINISSGTENVYNFFMYKKSDVGKKRKVKRPIKVSYIGNFKNRRNVEVEKIHLVYSEAKKIKSILDETFSSEDLSTSIYPEEQILIIKGSPEVISLGINLIDKLDVPRKQVRITAQILETKNGLFEDLGFNWIFTNKKSSIAASHKSATVQTNANVKGFDLGSTLFNFNHLFNSGADLLKLSLSMLQTVDDVSISSVPSVVVNNGKQAKFNVVEKTQTGTKTTVDQSGIIHRDAVYEDAGTIFTVTPIIKKNAQGEDVISLDIDSEVSYFKENPNIKDTLSKVKNNIVTNVDIQNNQTIFIGGLKRKKITRNVRKVPILGSIPYLGALFRSTKTTNEVKQIYIELKVELVGEDQNEKEPLNLDGFRVSPLSKKELETIYPKIGGHKIYKK